MAASKSGNRVYIAKESFAFTDEDGITRNIAAGTRYREGHSILKGRENLFKLDDSVNEE